MPSLENWGGGLKIFYGMSQHKSTIYIPIHSVYIHVHIHVQVSAYVHVDTCTYISDNSRNNVHHVYNYMYKRTLHIHVQCTYTHTERIFMYVYMNLKEGVICTKIPNTTHSPSHIHNIHCMCVCQHIPAKVDWQTILGHTRSQGN